MLRLLFHRCWFLASALGFITAVVCGMPAGVSAQASHPSATPDIGGNDTIPPVVTIIPLSGTYGSPLGVTVDWCDNVSLNASTRHIYIDNVEVTSSFTYTTSTKQDRGAHATSTGTVTLQSGNNLFSARIADSALNIGSNNATYTLSTAHYGVSVTPNGTDTVAAYATAKVIFAVQNTGNTTAQFTLKVTCSGTATGCQASPSSMMLDQYGGINDEANDTVSFQVGAGNQTGTVTLKASYAGDTTVNSSATYQITTKWLTYLVVSDAANNEDNQNARLCAASCFTAAYAQSTVPYISENTPRNVTLVYHGDRMAVRLFLYSDVALASGAYSDIQQYWLQAKVNWGGGWSALTFLNGNPGEQTLHFDANPSNPTQVVRLAGQLDASAEPTGMYPLQIIVTAQYADHTEQYVDSSLKLLVVNERHSPYGRGWTLGGIQHLYPQSDGSALITEGDGSALYFATCGTGCFRTPNGDFSALTVSGSGSSTVYRRAYPDSTIVLFNNLGQMTYRIALRMADTIFVHYDSLGRVNWITDPVRRQPPGANCPGCHASIGFWYAPSGGQIQIQEPGADGSTGQGRFTYITLGSDSTLQAIQDPDGVSTHFGYDATQRLAMVIDRRGDTTQYVYRADNSWKLAATVLPRVPIDNGSGGTTPGTPIVTDTAWQTEGVPTGPTATTPATPILPSAVTAATVDPAGHPTHFTVDRWGEPLVITEPLGRVTTITRSGVLPIQITRPTGAVNSATYNNGLPATIHLAGQSPTHIAYTAYALPDTISGPNQPTVIYTYGKNGRDSLATIDGKSTHYTTDARGRDSVVVDPSGHTWMYFYDTTFQNLDSIAGPGGRSRGRSSRVYCRPTNRNRRICDGIRGGRRGHCSWYCSRCHFRSSPSRMGGHCIRFRGRSSTRRVTGLCAP